MAITLSILYYLSLILGCVLSISLFKKIDHSLKFVGYLLYFTLVNELLSIFIDLVFKTKAFTYHIFTIVELILIMYYHAYFLYQSPSKKILIAIPIFCLILGIGNLVFLQPWKTMNTNMLMTECVLCIGMSLNALYILLKTEADDRVPYTHFLIWASILVMMTGTFFLWASFENLFVNNKSYKRLLQEIHAIINIIAYIGICVALIIYPKSYRNES